MKRRGRERERELGADEGRERYNYESVRKRRGGERDRGERRGKREKRVTEREIYGGRERYRKG